MKAKLLFVASFMLLGAGCASSSPAAQQAPAPVTSAPAAIEAKTFTVTGSNFSFSANEIRVKKSDVVRVTFKNAEGVHDWRLDEFGAATKKLQAGTEETVKFVADKVGTFEYYCSVGKHREMGMKGNLIVE